MILSLLWGLVPSVLPQDKKDAPPVAEPPLERLVELNAKELFGCDAQVKDGRVSLKLAEKGAFARAFRAGGGGGKGFITNIDDLKDNLLRGSLAGGVEGTFSFAGIESGEAISKFELAEEFTISFRMKAPIIAPGAQLSVRVNQEDAKNFIQTSFFQDLTVFEAGKPRRKGTSDPEFTGSPSKWFTQKNAEPQVTPVTIAFGQKKASVFVTLTPEKNKPKKVEVVSQDGIEKPPAGKIFIKFSKLNFGIADLAIDGKYNRPWAEAEIARLRKEKKLRLQAEDPEPTDKKSNKPDVARGKKPAADRKTEGAEKKAKRAKREPPDLTKPDPAADADL